MKKLRVGILGVGYIGKTIALRLAAAGYDVKVANSGDPDTVAKDVLATGAKARWTNEVANGVDVLILSIPLLKMPALKPLLAELPKEVVVIDTSNYYPSRDGKIEALQRGQVESEWVQEQLGRPLVKAWNNILAETLADLNKIKGHPGRLAIAVAADSKQGFEVAEELIDATGFDAYHSGPIADSWRQQPGAPAYCTDLKKDELPAALSAAERGRLSSRRDLAVAAVTERMSDGKVVPEPGYLVRLNRALYM